MQMKASMIKREKLRINCAMRLNLVWWKLGCASTLKKLIARVALLFIIFKNFRAFLTVQSVQKKKMPTPDSQ